jgi:uncharacterized repeat protein (TIGR01451 family)
MLKLMTLISVGMSCTLTLFLVAGVSFAGPFDDSLNDPCMDLYTASLGNRPILAGGKSLSVGSTRISVGRQATVETPAIHYVLASVPRNGSILGSLPLMFEPAAADELSRFFMRGPGYNTFVQPTEVVITPHIREATASTAVPRGVVDTAQGTDNAARASVLRLRFLGADPPAGVTGLDALPGKSNYFTGSDPDHWRTNVPNYARVSVDEIYPGIDVVYYGHKRELEFDFIVAPGADPGSIQFEATGANSVALHADGDLVLQTPTGEFRLRQPRIYQDVAGTRLPVEGRYVLHTGVASSGSHRIGFQLAAYDASQPLVIDPALGYATRIGGSALDTAEDIALDDAGNTYITGYAQPAGFPGADGGSPEFIGPGGGNDVFIMKLAADGSTVLFSTFLGGEGDDKGRSIAVDDQHNVYVAGTTSFFGRGFPATAGAFDTNGADFFVSKLDATGSNLLYSTFLGGANLNTHFGGIAVHPCGIGSCIYFVAGSLTGYPTTANAYQRFLRAFDANAVFSILDPAQIVPADQLVYSTFLGGSGRDGAVAVAVGPNGKAYITGNTKSPDFPLQHAFDTTFAGSSEGFMTVIDPSQSGVASLVYSTYIGGDRDDNEGPGFGGIAVGPSGVALVAGTTSSFDFPVTPEGFRVSRESVDAFFIAIDPSLPGSAALRYGTYIGGTHSDVGIDIAAGPAGIAYITGYTLSPDLPGSDGGTAPKFGAGSPGQHQDAFVVKMDWTRIGAASLIDAAYVGGTGPDFARGIAVDEFGNSYITGQTSSSDGFVPSPGTGSSDAFVASVNTIISLPTGTTGTLSTDTLSTNFGTPPYAWALFTDAPPAGLQLDGDGTLTGIPTETGTSTFTVEITDSLAATHQQTYRKRIGTGGVLGDVLIRKAGVAPIPGRILPYYILLRNQSEQTLYNVGVVELLQGWFEFIGSSPPPTLLEPRPTGNVYWTIPEMSPGQLELITYRVRLPAEFPFGVEVSGEACLTINDCNAEKAECLKEGKVRCDDSSCGWHNLGSQCLQCNLGEQEICKLEWWTCFRNVGDGKSEDCKEGFTCGGCATKKNRTRGPADPNEKAVASELFIPSGEMIGYTIHFENIGNAEARDVFLTDVLDTDLDLSTVQVAKPFGGLIPLPPESTVSIFDDNDEQWNVTLDSASRTILWELTNIDLPAGATDGVFFVIQAPEGLPSGTEIRNESTIQFEVFEPLTTNETLNIIDDSVPECVVDPLPATTAEPEFTVSWTGADPVGEIELFLVYVSTNGGPFLQVERSDSPSSATFTGEVGSTYGFLCIARDTADNIEVLDQIAETTTTVESAIPNEPPDADAGTDVTAELGGAVILDGSGSQDPDRGPASLSFSWRFLAVPEGSALMDGNIARADTAQPEFTPDVDGFYRLELMVFDGAAENSDEVEVTIETAAAPVCDVDGDGNVDLADISLIIQARNTPASGSDDPRDWDGDGLITVLDARGCVVQCTNPRCAP